MRPRKAKRSSRFSYALLLNGLVCVGSLSISVTDVGAKSAESIAASSVLRHRHLTKVTDHAVDAEGWDLKTGVAHSQMQDPFRTGNSKIKLVSIESRTVSADRKRLKAGIWKLPKTIGLDGLENAYDPTPWLNNGELAPKFHFPMKVQFMKGWLEKQDPDDFIIYIDSDVIWGGCSEQQFMRDFEAITQASNSSLVTGAEFGCAAVYEPTRGFECPINSRSQQKIKKGYSYIPKPAWAKTLYGDDGENWVRQGHVDMNCTEYSAGPCGDPPEMIFLNSGFVAGKARDMLELYTFQDRMYKEKKVYGKFLGDQNAFNQYFYDSVAPIKELNHIPRARMTLDYGNRLVTNLHGMDVKIKALSEDALTPPFYGFEEASMFEVLPNGDMKNKASNQHSCFIHGNGYGKPALEKMQKMRLSLKGIRDPYTYKYAANADDEWWRIHMGVEKGETRLGKRGILKSLPN